jgi:D-tyrosyl-tRNA(Tyr) deacylase
LRALVQRVSEASVTVGDETVGRIGAGLLVFIGLSKDDSEAEARHIVDKTVNLRIFPDETGRFNRSALDVGAALLVISQFTLYGDTRRGRRPWFGRAAAPARAEALYEELIVRLRACGLRVSGGRFQAHMAVAAVNDGPVTILLDSAREF